jgi:biopolymer transport protein ExbD
MNFRPGSRDEPEINLIPFIDILLVVLIFLVLSTTYSKYTELQIRLPVADADAAHDRPREVVVSVGQDGHYSVAGAALEQGSVEALSTALAEAAKGDKDSIIVINADASATHQSVINVMDAARRTGLAQITFATQSSGNASSGAARARPGNGAASGQH